MTSCTLGEMMIAALARTVEDGTLVFHGYGSPLAQLAMQWRSGPTRPGWSWWPAPPAG
ncbi:MAG: hypothetical protein WBW81_12570 [Methylocella sp.]